MNDAIQSQVVAEMWEYWNAALRETKSVVSLVETGKPIPLDSARRRVNLLNGYWLKYMLHTMRSECQRAKLPHEDAKDWLRTQVVILRMAEVKIKIPERLLE